MSLAALAPGETRERSLTWFDWSLLADMSRDGKTIVFSETGEAEGTNYSIFLRKTDGSPAIRLGDGGFGSLSPDGQWVVSTVGAPAKLMLLPTGVGEPKQLTDDKHDHFNVAWLPDSKSIIFSAAESGHGPRTYLIGSAGWRRERSDSRGYGRFYCHTRRQDVLARDPKHQLWLYPIAGGSARKLNFSPATDEGILGLSGDGKNLLVATRGVPLQN